MKTRTDFVSNSSSSSFILKDRGFFKLFGLTKADVHDVITEMYGRDQIEKELADEIGTCELRAVHAAVEGNTEGEEYYSSKARRLKESGLGLWKIYDMTDPVEASKCRSEYENFFSWYVAPNEGDAESWETVIDIFKYKCSLSNIEEISRGKTGDLTSVRWEKGSDGWKRTEFAGSGDLVRYIKESLGAKTMIDVLNEPECTMMLHFEDNVLWLIPGMSEDSKEYLSKPETPERFFELMINRLEKNGRVNLLDKRLLEFWRVPEGDTTFRKTEPGQEYYIIGKATPINIYVDLLNVNAVLHEG